MSKVPVATRAPPQEANGGAPRKIPKVGDIACLSGSRGNVDHAALRVIIMEKLATCDRMIAIDVETHDKVPRGSLGTWLTDQFGLRTRTPPETTSSLRVIEVGYAVGTISEDLGRNEILVKPDGFAISPAGTELHGITQEMADENGWPLQEALRKMVNEVLKECSRGGYLVSHNLPFDAALIYEELGCRRLEVFPAPTHSPGGVPAPRSATGPLPKQGVGHIPAPEVGQG